MQISAREAQYQKEFKVDFKTKRINERTNEKKIKKNCREKTIFSIRRHNIAYVAFG